MHWAQQYLREQWTPEHDCLYWFRRITADQYGVCIPAHQADHSRLLLSSAKLMSDDILTLFGYQQTDNPQEGDGVFMTQRTRPHHLGMVVVVGGKIQILHALEGSGILVSDPADLALNGWRVVSYWTRA